MSRDLYLVFGLQHHVAARRLRRARTQIPKPTKRSAWAQFAELVTNMSPTAATTAC